MAQESGAREGAVSGETAVQSANLPIQLISRRSVGAPTSSRSISPWTVLPDCSVNAISHPLSCRVKSISHPSPAELTQFLPLLTAELSQFLTPSPAELTQFLRHYWRPTTLPVGTSQTCRGCREKFSLRGCGAAPHTFQSTNHQSLCVLCGLCDFQSFWQSCRR